MPPPVCVPIVTIDGTAASGKGTLAQALAQALGFTYLDSGVLYRSLAYAASLQRLESHNTEQLTALAQHLPLQCHGAQVVLDGQDISALIRTQAIGQGASAIGAIPAVRQALLERQRAFAVLPGLVAEGRDMGSVVFPQAQLKIFVTAALAIRARRRWQQLLALGETTTLAAVALSLKQRDAADKTRSVAPLLRPIGAKHMSTSARSVEASVAQLLAWWNSR